VVYLNINSPLIAVQGNGNWRNLQYSYINAEKEDFADVYVLILFLKIQTALNAKNSDHFHCKMLQIKSYVLFGE